MKVKNQTSNLKTAYDQRYSGDYRKHLSIYEIARWKALDHFLTVILSRNDKQKVMDYGSGNGLYIKLWEKLFPEAKLYFCDISSVAIKKLKAIYPQYASHCQLVDQNIAQFNNDMFDLIVSIEVMEHVESLNYYLQDIHRLLKPGGQFLWTTPCANEWSIEHIYNVLTGNIDSTAEGYRRWNWEDPMHVRRLRSSEIKIILKKHGFFNIKFRFRAHFFSFLCTYFYFKNIIPWKNRLMTLDYRLFRRLTNGASMIGVATKII